MSLDITLKTNVCKCCGRGDEVYHANITHNLNEMAVALGIYEVLWHPDECKVKTAEQLIPVLQKAIKYMEGDPTQYQQFDAKNGWGTFEHFLPFVKKYLKACKQYPDAVVEVDS